MDFDYLKSNFRQIIVIDFEYYGGAGDPPSPICLSAKELKSGKTLKLWCDEFGKQCPFDTGKDSLFVAYYASAEFSCFDVLGWRMPYNVLDLFIEFRMLTNGNGQQSRGLLGALSYFGKDSIGATQKESYRDRILQGPPYSTEEKRAILDYCHSDVKALCDLLPPMCETIESLPRALYRGEYMKAAACIENMGVPIDVPTLERLLSRWTDIQKALILSMDSGGIYEGNVFKEANFERYLKRKGRRWPQHDSGRLCLDRDTFKDMARVYPDINEYHQLRTALSQLKLRKLQVGTDGRNRCLLSAYGAKTGRNTPSNSKFIFGPAVWMRSLIVAPEDYGMAYIDYEQQEFAIAAYLSQDPKMLSAYESGDPYLTFGKMVGAIPSDATKETAGPQRDVFKQIILATNYGMGPISFASRINQPVSRASELLNLHRTIFHRYWKWSDDMLDRALLHQEQRTLFGWKLKLNGKLNARSIRNFPMQGNGSEMLRLACIKCVNAGVQVSAPVHDALLVLAPLNEFKDVVSETQRLMEDASEILLPGFRVRTDKKEFEYPHRFVDPRGVKMWETVQRLLSGQELDIQTKQDLKAELQNFDGL